MNMILHVVVVNANYRPISNLCTISKVYEKLILQQLLKLAKEANIDLTGE